MFQRMRLVAVCFVLMACAASSAKADLVIFDNITQTLSGLQAVTTKTGTNGWWAEGFTSPGTSINLNSATFLMVGAGMSFDIKLYLSDGNPTTPVPTGSSLATIYSGSPGVLSGTFTVSGLNIPLIANTNYFVATEVSSGSVFWQYTNASTNPTASNYGPGWVGSTAFPLQMKLQNTSVPEPSTLALAGVASSCMWCVRRFRRRQSA